MAFSAHSLGAQVDSGRQVALTADGGLLAAVERGTARLRALTGRKRAAVSLNLADDNDDCADADEVAETSRAVADRALRDRQQREFDRALALDSAVAAKRARTAARRAIAVPRLASLSSGKLFVF